MKKPDDNPAPVIQPFIVGIDTGGTFTDFVVYDGREIRIHKQLSTPHSPELAIIEGLRALGLADRGCSVIHGSTVATNAALENKGAVTVFITNRGHADMLSIGRQARQRLYDLQPRISPPPVPAEFCLETGGRIGTDGSTLEPLTENDLRELQERLRTLQPEAVAINLLFSFVDDSYEKRIAAVIPDNIFVSRSSAILPEYREFERGVTTWLNARVGPLVQHYLQRLQRALPSHKIAVMQSSGGTAAANEAGALAVHMLLSGPAGGLSGARHIGDLTGNRQILTFDMGGTSTDVALIDGEPKLTSEGRIGTYPVAVPMVDIHTIGAGGGSIAYLDEGGLLQVGPESAGAAPGPACYGLGGGRPTVTDANVVLGRLPAQAALGGTLRLNVEAARKALTTIADPLGISIEHAAAGIIRLANEHMAQALRVISVQRGLDPRDYALMSFGGAGGLHVCALAEALGIRKAVVPAHAGVLSAFGMLAAPRTRHVSRTFARRLDIADETDIAEGFTLLIEQARHALIAEGIRGEEIAATLQADLRYVGQSFTLTLPWDGIQATQLAFHDAHLTRYGHRLEFPVELVTLRVRANGPRPDVSLPATTRTHDAERPKEHVQVYEVGEPVEIWLRDALPREMALSGPLIVSDTISTTYVAPGWACVADQWGNLSLLHSGG